MKIRGNPLVRLLDRLFGPGLLILLRLFPLACRHPGKRIIILTNAALGDAILYSGLLSEIIRIRQDVGWYLAADEPVHEILSLLGVDEQIRRLPLSFGHPLQSSRALRRIKARTILDVGQWSRTSAIMARLSGAAERIGFWRHWQGRAIAFTKRVAHRSDRHEFDNFVELFSQLLPAGAPPLKREHVLPRLSPLEGADPLLRQLVPQGEHRREKPLVVLHFFAGGTRPWMKELSSEQAQSLLERLAERGYRIVLSGSQGDQARARALLERGRFANNKPSSACGLSLRQSATLIAAAAVVISVNTGIMHLAAAAGTPLVAIHGPTNPLRWGPLGDPQKIRIVRAAAGCQGCLDLGSEYRCRRRPPACLEAITLDEIIASVDWLLDKRAP